MSADRRIELIAAALTGRIIANSCMQVVRLSDTHARSLARAAVEALDAPPSAPGDCPGGGTPNDAPHPYGICPHCDLAVPISAGYLIDHHPTTDGGHR